MGATYIAGIAASGAWDTAGESIDIKQMDISSLPGAVLNWEHESKKSSDYVGKVLKAKKIFSADDCANDVEMKYWLMCQIPFLFCLGVLFDEYQPAAKDCAGIFAFDEAHPELPPTLGFSIEGAKQEKVDGVITYSIARKLTITATPANKTCRAGKVSMDAAPKDPLDFLFKSESKEIELFGEETLQKSMSMKPAAPKPPGLKQPAPHTGTSIGTTSSGKHVMSHEKVHAYTDFNAEDHRNASVLHTGAAMKANTNKNYQLADHHNQKKKLHDQAAAAIERKGNRFSNAVKNKRTKDVFGINKSEDLAKALNAGSGTEAPGAKTGGAALQKEDLTKKDTVNAPVFNHVAGKKTSPGTKAGMGMSQMGTKVRHGDNGPFTAIAEAQKNLKKLRGAKKPNLGKSDEWLARAQEEYQKWPHREEFEKFMKIKLPHLAKGEIESLGKILVLKKSVEMEKSLQSLMDKDKPKK